VICYKNEMLQIIGYTFVNYNLFIIEHLNLKGKFYSKSTTDENK